MQLWSLLLWSCEDSQKVGDTSGLARGCCKIAAEGSNSELWGSARGRGRGGRRKTPGDS